MGRLFGQSIAPMNPISGGGRLFGGRITGKPDLSTSEGLYNLAAQSGLKNEADKIMKVRGEEPKKIFSGGWISDTFDVLNTLQYGIVGMIKGKGFAQGVKSRESFSDKDSLGDFGLPGTIMGIALDIALDPLTYIPPLAIAKRIPGVAKAAKGIMKTAKATRAGQWFGRKFVYRFGQDKVYKELADRTIKNIAVGNQNLVEITQPIFKLSAKAQRSLVTRKGARIIRKPLSELKGVLDPDTFKSVEGVWNKMDELGEEASRLGLFPRATWEANKGEYIANLYKEFEAPKGALAKLRGIFPTKPKRIKGARFKKAKLLEPETLAKRKELGEITEAGYPLVKGMMQLNHDIANAKLFGEVSKKFSVKTARKGFEKLPSVNSLGDLTSKYVPKPIFDDIQEIMRARTAAEKGLGKVVAGFKFGKVIMNPATHARNVLSNSLLNYWDIGLGPWRLDIYGEAAKQMATKGKYWKEARKVGLGLDTFAAREINDLLLGPEGLAAGKKFSKSWKNIAKKLGDIYQGEEEFAKMSAYIFLRKSKGMPIETAWKAAERATFNYAQVTPFIRRLRESIWGFPFITFSVKATPLVAKTFLKHPTRISNIGKIKQAIENMSGLEELKRERATEAPWIKDGLYIKLPMKDKHGRSAYFDMTYILPFGDLISGQLVERKEKRETGLPESWVEALLRKAPFINVIKELGSNQDFYGNKIWKESDDSDKQLGDLFRHLTKTYLPPLVADQIPGGYMKDGQRRPGIIPRVGEAGAKNTYRTFGQEAMRSVGIKVQPIQLDMQESYSEWNSRKALETLLRENNIIQQFQTPYVPQTQGNGRLF